MLFVIIVKIIKLFLIFILIFLFPLYNILKSNVIFLSHVNALKINQRTWHIDVESSPDFGTPFYISSELSVVLQNFELWRTLLMLAKPI